METAGGRGGGRKHAAREFHTFSLHDNHAEFLRDLMHDTDYSQDSECSEDSDSPIGTQLPVDYSDLELLHHHLQGYEAHTPHTLTGINGGATNAGSGAVAAGGSEAAQGGCSVGAEVGLFDEAAGSDLGSGHQSGPASRGRSGARCRHQSVRVYTNLDTSGAKRSRRHQRREDSSLRDEAHGHDGNSRARDTGLESQRVSSQHIRRRTGCGQISNCKRR